MIFPYRVVQCIYWDILFLFFNKIKIDSRPIATVSDYHSPFWPFLLWLFQIFSSDKLQLYIFIYFTGYWKVRQSAQRLYVAGECESRKTSATWHDGIFLFIRDPQIPVLTIQRWQICHRFEQIRHQFWSSPVTYT